MKDRTHMGIAMYDYAKGTFKEWKEDILYKDYTNYDDIPEPCQSKEIEEEFKAYKEWEKSLDIVNKLTKQIERIRGQGIGWGRGTYD